VPDPLVRRLLSGRASSVAFPLASRPLKGCHDFI
jgi:hypothetical protein